MRTAVYPGSFDPVTNGHLDVVARAATLFDEVVVAVLVNAAKSTLFSVEERRDLLRTCLDDRPNVTVETFDGLVVDFCAARGSAWIVKGFRAVSDVDYELQMARMNSRLAGVETVFVPSAPEYSFVASTLIKEVAAYGGDVSGLVPPSVLAALERRLAPRR